MWFLTVDVDFDHLAEVAFARSLHYNVTLFLSPFPYCTLEGSHLEKPTFREWEVMLPPLRVV